MPTKMTIVLTQQDAIDAGDAYDLYLDENNMILEWTFREEMPRWKKLSLGQNCSNNFVR